MLNTQLIVLTLLLNSTFIFSEDLDPKVIPPSPHAQEFTKYIDYPVDYSSGLTKNEIPIYTVKCGSIELPISISYHSSGLIPTSETGIIGLGWNLNYGGIISRTIKQLPDERHYNNLIPTETEINNNENLGLYGISNGSNYWALLGSMANLANTYDSKYDIFNYTLPNQSGRFIFARGTDVSVLKTPILLPFQPVQITPNIVGSIIHEISFSHFDILDEMGNQYRFGKSLKSGSEIYEDYHYLSSPTTHQAGKSAWLLTEMISANKADTIFFEYEDIWNASTGRRWITKSHQSFQNSYTELIYDGPTGTEAEGANNGKWDYTGSFSAYEYTTKRIKKIRFKKNEVSFTYKSEYYPNSLLTSIDVFDNITGKTIKSIVLNQTKYHNDAALLNWDKLDSISFYNGKGEKLNRYSFEYENPFASFPRNQGNNETYSLDHWGYYNGAQNSNPIPPNAPSHLTSVISGSADRNPNPNYSKVGILKKINYPEGGSASFSYSGNSINSNIVGGLRIDQVILQTDNQQIKKTFQYNHAEGVSTILPIFYLTRSGYRESNYCYFIDGKYIVSAARPLRGTETYSSDITCDITLNGRPVVYTNVTEHFGDITSYTSKIDHFYDGSILDYGLIPTFYRPSSNPVFELLNYSVKPPTDYYQSHLNFGIVNKIKSIYYNSSNNVVKTINWHHSHQIKNTYNGLHARRLYVNYIGPDEETQYFAYATYTIEQISQTLDSVVTKVYDNNFQNPVYSKESFTYNSYLFPTTIEKIQSDKSIIKTIYRYPSDINTGVYASMLEKNMLNYPIEERVFKNNNIIGNKITTFKEYYPGRYVPDKIYKLETESPLPTIALPYFNGSYISPLNGNDPAINFVQYDIAGNINQIKTNDNINTVYLWSYNRQYPIAEIKNATVNDVAGALQGITIDQLSVSSIPDMTKIDGLRTALPNALVTTYTYKPLVGMTSMTDPRGLKTSYYYDNFNRLFLVRDNQGNLISQNNYGYQNMYGSSSGGYSAGKITTGTAYSFGANGTATINTSNIATEVGGSGNYSYNWYLKRPNGSVISSTLNSALNSFSFICSDAGALTIQCDVKDNQFGNTYSASCITNVSEGSFIINSNFTQMGSNLAFNGTTTVNFGLGFVCKTEISPYSTLELGILSNQYRPATEKTLPFAFSGRTCIVTIKPDGKVLITNQSTSPLASNSSLSFNLSYTL